MKKLNFGCGSDIKDGWDNVDIEKSDKLTKSFDFNIYPYPIKDNIYDYILARCVLEHLDKPEKTLLELWRISKPKGIIDIIVPHHANKGAYDDIEHKHFFNENCFTFFIRDKRKIEDKKAFRIVNMFSKPSRVGRVIPKRLRAFLSLFINGLYTKIFVRLEVVK